MADQSNRTNAPMPAEHECHFPFGENWRSFVATVDEASIQAAVAGLTKLLPSAEFSRRSMLDIGCGSGLSLLAAIRLGARNCRGVDVDPNSVEAARTLLGKWSAGASWSADVQSVFALDPARDGRFDIVYSWGVLHHTGDMWRAVSAAAAMVGPQGRLVIALYRKTPLCPAWKIEKRIYAHAPKPLQGLIRAAYRAVFKLALIAQGRSPAEYIAGYKSTRGMDWDHDVHDWLGGWPYESATAGEVTAHLAVLGFAAESIHEHAARAGGLFGSHCDEYVFRRKVA